MANLARTARLLAAPIIHIAVEAAGTSDVDTKPAAANAAWLQLPCATNVTHERMTHEEPYDCPDADTGWAMDTDRWVLGNEYVVTSRDMTGLYEQLIKALESAIVEGTAQTPFVNAQPEIKAWVKMQFRKTDGTDNEILDIWCRIRPEDAPDVAKAVQTPAIRLHVLKSSLNAVVYPAAA